jgi:hypothetical protein
VSLEDAGLEALGDEGRHGVIMEVQTNGENYRAQALHAKGSDQHPMSRAEVTDKFRLLASRVLSPALIEELTIPFSNWTRSKMRGAC